MAGENWFDTGFAQAKEIAKRRNEGVFEGGLQRFWVKVGEERQIIFLDDFNLKIKIGDNEIDAIPFGFWEHSIKLDGEWKNPVFTTCVGPNGGCLPCEKKYRRQHVGAMTILDISPYTDRETGKTVVKPWKKLMVAVTDALLTIEAKKNKRGNLKGCRYSVARHDNRHPRVGSDFEQEEKIEDLKARYPDLNLAPYGYDTEKTTVWYKELFKPKTREELEKIFSSHMCEDGFAIRPKTGTGVSGTPAGDSTGTPVGTGKEAKDDRNSTIEY